MHEKSSRPLSMTIGDGTCHHRAQYFLSTCLTMQHRCQQLQKKVLLGAAGLWPPAVLAKSHPVMPKHWHNGIAPSLQAGIPVQDPAHWLMRIPCHLVRRDDLNRHLHNSRWISPPAHRPPCDWRHVHTPCGSASMIICVGADSIWRCKDLFWHL